MKPSRTIAILLSVVALTSAAQAADYHLILTGSGGEAEYGERFTKWGDRLSRALESQAGAKKENIVWLSETADGSVKNRRQITLESIEEAFTEIAARAGAEDDVYVYIIGHGSAYSRTSKFHIPGPDVAAEDFAEWLSLLNVRRIAVVNAAPASAGFVNALSGPNRVICAATKSLGEFNATRFMDFFIQSLEDGSADRNRDERVSFHELCAQASELTAAWYTAEGLIPTEHAILDDNGDGLGTRLFNPEMAEPEDPAQLDGSAAGKLYVKDYVFPESVPRELVDAYLAALSEIDLWKEKKAELDRDPYYDGLENLLLKAARLNRDIRKHLPPNTGNS